MLCYGDSFAKLFRCCASIVQSSYACAELSSRHMFALVI